MDRKGGIQKGELLRPAADGGEERTTLSPEQAGVGLGAPGLHPKGSPPVGKRLRLGYPSSGLCMEVEEV
jgi:hypothetical protein